MKKKQQLLEEQKTQGKQKVLEEQLIKEKIDHRKDMTTK